MSRTSILIVSLTAAMTFPAVASAHCGTTQGSFAVTCEQGVKVYRHNAPSALPRGLSAAQASLEAEKLRQSTAQSRIEAQARSQAAMNALRQRELDIKEYRARISARNARRSGYVYGVGYGGYRLARPIRVRAKH